MSTSRTAERVTSTQMDRFGRLVAERFGSGTGDYDDLWSWSVEHPARFWRAVWEFFDLDALAAEPLGPGDEAVLADDRMPGAVWFPGMRLNYVDQILRHAALPGAAIVGIDEAGDRSEIAWAELPAQVAGLAAALRARGVGSGDVVAAYLPDIPEAVIAFLATASLGAIWSGCGQDYAPQGAAGRLGQLAPKVLFTAAGYRYNGKVVDKKHPDFIRCKTEPVIGSRARKRRVCLTNRQWAEVESQGKGIARGMVEDSSTGILTN